MSYRNTQHREFCFWLNELLGKYHFGWQDGESNLSKTPERTLIKWSSGESVPQRTKFKIFLEESRFDPQDKQKMQMLYTALKNSLKSTSDDAESHLLQEASRTSDSSAHHPLRKHILDFDFYVEEKSQGFLGRQWMIEKIDQFLESGSGYFHIMGEPGIGKSSIAAYLVKQRQYVHHFNTRLHGVTNKRTLISNLCAQLIVKYKLDYDEFPPGYADNNLFLNQILKEVSQSLKRGEECVIVIDALDELENAMSFKLPQKLPDRVCIILLGRFEVTGGISSKESLVIDPKSPDNIKDVKLYISKKIDNKVIWKSIQNSASSSIDKDHALQLLTDKSEGNFVYLHYVFFNFEIGALSPLSDLPQGLRRYYEDHWLRMKGSEIGDWHQVKLPILVVLCFIYEPLPAPIIMKYSSSKSLSIVLDVIQEWRSFLFEEQQCYRIYHKSFFDFLTEQEQIKSDREQNRIAEIINQMDQIMYDDSGGDETFNMDDDDNPFL